MYGALFSAHRLKNEVNYTRSAFVSDHGLKNEVYSCVGPLFWLMVLMRCRFQLLTSGLTAFPFATSGTNGSNRQIIFARPHGFQVLIRCSLHMVYQSPEELTIRANGTNRKASLTTRNSLPVVRLVTVF